MASLDTICGLHYEMMRRCYNEKCVTYACYGAKGITVYEEWHKRENFVRWAKENGYQKGMRLERIDGNGNYEPSNCRFGYSCVRKEKTVQKRNEKAEKQKKRLEAGIEGALSKDPLYATYNSMHTRCENPNSDNFARYGARGIKVCKEWSGVDGFINFKRWANNNGWREGLTIDRIDNNKGYYPNNCRWATPTEQDYNKRNNILYDYGCAKLPLGMIAKIEGVKYGLLYSRVRLKGMDLREALNDIKKRA